MAFLWFNRNKTPSPRENARTYVAHGDSQWGNSISYRNVGDNEVDVSGWLSRAPFPQEGDRLLIKMQSGQWGIYVFTESKRCRDPRDMFQGMARGAIDYWPEDDAPQTTACDEFILDKSAFSR